ncbi:MAG: hypothetical protein P4M05_36140 [Bradyrhizobium sp.]|nr:hypothetical protein [Bradyrhizobium sp.]
MKGKGVRSENTQTYLSGGSSTEALHQIDIAYGESRSGKPAIFSAMGQEKIELYWATPNDLDLYRSGAVNVGARARLWALSLLLVEYAHHRPSVKAICDEISEWAVRADEKLVKDVIERADVGEPTGDLDRSLNEQLRNLVSPRQKERCPGAGAAPGLLKIVINYCAHHFFRPDERGGSRAAFEAAATAAHAKPSNVFTALVDAVPEERRRSAQRSGGARQSKTQLRSRLNEVSQLDPSIDRIKLDGQARQYEKAQAGDCEDEAVEKLFLAITRGGRGKRRWIVVSGPRFYGKKAKVDALLRRLADDDDNLVAKARSARGDKTIDLPIGGWSAKGVHYRELISNVVRFLRHYRGRAGIDATRDPPTVPLATASIEELFELIRTLHVGAPALYIFTDVDAFHRSFDRNVIRDVGIRRLIQSLLQSNEESMVLITTSEDLNKDTKYVAGMPPRETIEVAAPNLSSFAAFVRPDIRSITQRLFYESEHDFLRGDDLICIASLFNLAETLSSEQTIACADFLREAPDARDELRKRIYKELIFVLKDQQLLHSVALIAATDDGLLLASLHRLLVAWSEHLPDATPPSLVQLDERLRQAADRANGYFLLNSRMVRYDVEEFAPDEAHSASDRVWELDPLVGAMFLDALAEIDSEMFTGAHRLVAAAARARAQTKKAKMRSPLGTRATEDASRDIQCYVSLLASIKLDEPAPPVEELPLRLSEHEIFSLDPAVFQARRSLRFAILCLLQEDIDRDHRLTMVFDEDALRLELYLLLFQPLGRRHHTLLGPLRVPAELPEHLSQAYFTDDQLLSFMNTVALSAYHAQRFDVVRGIAELSERVAVERGIPEYPAKIARVWCSQIDACIMRGGVPDQVGHNATLIFVTELRQKHFHNVDGRKLVDTLEGSRREKQTLAWFKSDMRLLARQAELQGLIGNEAQASYLYDELKRRETQLAERFTDHDPLILSGRVARRYIRFLLESLMPASVEQVAEAPCEVTRPTREREAILQQVRNLLGVNTSRLRRFSGGDRVGVMIDHARLAFAEGKLVSAHSWAVAANVRAQNGSVSHGGRLEALAVCADIRLLVEAAGIAENPDLELELAEDEIEELDTIATALDYVPSIGIAAHLKSRLKLQQYLASGRTGTPRVRNLLLEAHRLAAKADRKLNECLDRSFRALREKARTEIQFELEVPETDMPG